MLSPDNEPMDVIWKDTTMDPSNNLTKMSQFVGAYAYATIDKVVKVKQLIRKKYERIQQLEQHLAKEKQNVNHQMEAQMTNYSRALIN